MLDTLKNNKIDTIYIAKCLGIFIVVLMHVFDTVEDAWSVDNAINIVLHSFAMPVFMVLSGFVLAGKNFTDNWLTKKCSKLIGLIIISTIIYWLFATLFPDLTLLREYFYIYDGLSLPAFIYGALQVGFGLTVSWYIFVMIQIYVVLWLLQKISKLHRLLNINILIVVGIIIINILPYYNMGFADVKWYGCFMLIGYIIGNYKVVLSKFLWIGYIAIPAFILTAYFTNWFVDWQDLDYGSRGFTIPIRDITDGKIDLLLMMIWMIFTGGLSLITISRLINKVKAIRKYFIYIGTLTLGIYLIHPLFTGITNNYMLTYGIVLVISIGLSAIFGCIYKKYKIVESIKAFVNRKNRYNNIVKVE